MGNSHLQETIQQLEDEIKEKQAALKVLKQMAGHNSIEQHPGTILPVSNTSKFPPATITLHTFKAFPINARTDKQVMYLFDNTFNRAQRFSEIQSKFNELLGQKKNVYNVCRLLKKQGLLATVQYNKQNRLSFWGKAEWLGETDFKEEFKPDANEMPVNVFDIKILTDDDDDNEVKTTPQKTQNGIIDDLPF